MISRRIKLPVAALERIDAACEQFEKSWRSGSPQSIEAALAEVEDTDERSALYVELLALEIDYRRQRDESLVFAEYTKRFPNEELATKRVFVELGLATDSVVELTKAKGSDSSLSSPSSAFGKADLMGGMKFHEGRYVVLEKLGVGGFATVYRAFDQSLQRDVAIKVPHAHRAEDYDLERYLAEARLVAKLDHPSIVPVYDAGRGPDGVCYVVSKLIKGQNLAQRLREGRPSEDDAVDIIVQVADALTHAHERGLVHRDLKPANLLIDSKRNVHVTDFGLAMELDTPSDADAFVGTPAYMSPEQAARESHLIDHRTDIFSLGVIFYELLTGRRPFIGSRMRDVLEAIREGSCASPSQYVPGVSAALDRICMRAIAPRISDRYASAHELRNELSEVRTGVDDLPRSTPGTSTRVAGNQNGMKVVPRGLRSFDESDSASYVELLPGPFDRTGLPIALSFWLKRIMLDGQNPFRIGLLAGASGSGKSSLVKAGIIPRLGSEVVPLFVEASAEHTETAMLETIVRKHPDLAGCDLVKAFSKLRNSEGDRKHVVFLDQFEQWLRRHEADRGGELLDALRHCDGNRLQCVLLVRDEFGMMAARLLQELDVRVEQGNNFAAVESLPAKHARQTLAKFGRALGQLPERPDEITQEQESFLDSAMESLSQNGRVIPVQLALFTEIMKNREWAPHSWSESGEEGLGIAYLEQSLGENVSHPECRLHRDAARKVLKALLPPRNVEIKGSLRTRDELLEASGHDRQRSPAAPAETKNAKFDALMRLLDRELRLVTPTESTHRASEENETNGGEPEVGYLLAHDFMVTPLREWLTRKDKESFRGRAELCLEERAIWWKASRASKHLPSLSEWLNILLFARSHRKTPDEREMMRSANRYYVLRTALTVGFIALSVFGWRSWTANRQANLLVQQIVNAKQNELPQLVNQTTINSSQVRDLLKANSAKSTLTTDQHLNLLLARSRSEATPPEELWDRWLAASAEEFATGCRTLAPIKDTLLPKLETLLTTASTETAERRFRAACALAQYAPDRIPDEHVQEVVGQLLRHELLELKVWAELMSPLKDRIAEPLVRYFEDSSDPQTQRVATTLLAQLHEDDPDQLIKLLLSARGQQLASLLPSFQRHEATLLPRLRQRWSESFRTPTPPLEGVSINISSILEESGGQVGPMHAFAMRLSETDLEFVNKELQTAGYELEQSIQIMSEADTESHFTTLWRRGRDASHHGPKVGSDIVEKEQSELVFDPADPNLRQMLCARSDSRTAARGEFSLIDLRHVAIPNQSEVPAIPWLKNLPLRRKPREHLEIPKNSPWQIQIPPIQFSHGKSFTLEAWVGDWSGGIISQQTVRGSGSLWMSVGNGEGADASIGWDAPDGRVVCRLSLGEEKLQGWHHLAFVFDGKQAICFLDGKVKDSAEIDTEEMDLSDAVVQEPIRLARVLVNGKLRTASGDLAAVRISQSARYVAEFIPDKQPTFDANARLYLNVTRATLPAKHLGLPEDRITDDPITQRIGARVRHVFTSGYDTQANNLLSRRLTDLLFRPVWFGQPDSSSSGSQRWQSRWTRARTPALRVTTSIRLANLVVALWRLDEVDSILPAFALRSNNELRSRLITLLADAGCNPETILPALSSTSDAGIRQALILSLGQFGAQAIPESSRPQYLTKLKRIYETDRDAGVHSAIEFVSERWNYELPQVAMVDDQPRSHGDWISGPNRHQFAVIDTPNPLPGIRQYRNLLAPKYAISLRPVTTRQYEEAFENVGDRPEIHPEKPAEYVTFHNAAAYCNWLSERAGIPASDWCFEAGSDGQLQRVPDYLNRRGFRLPTVEEWRLACGGGVRTRFPSGTSPSTLEQYAWTGGNSLGVSTVIGVKKPNWCGLFDILGSVGEWTCHELQRCDQSYEFVCGVDRGYGTYAHEIEVVRKENKKTSNYKIGFRIAQTLDAAPSRDTE